MIAVTTIQYNTQYRNNKKIKKAKDIEGYNDEKIWRWSREGHFFRNITKIEPLYMEKSTIFLNRFLSDLSSYKNIVF